MKVSHSPQSALEACFRDRMDVEVVEGDVEDESLDVVYIDENKTYEDTIKNLTIWLPKVKYNGFICGSNYSGETKRAVNKFIVDYVVKHGSRNWQTPIKRFPDKSWLFRKI